MAGTRTSAAAAPKTEDAPTQPIATPDDESRVSILHEFSTYDELPPDESVDPPDGSHVEQTLGLASEITPAD